MLRYLSIVALLASCLSASAQTGTPTKQSGNVTPSHATCWTTNGIVQDCGTAAIPFLTSIGTVGQGQTICAWSALSTAPGSQKICFGVSDSTGASLVIQNFGIDAPKPFSIVLNGTTYQFPYAVGGIVGPGTTVVGDVAVWNNTVGTLLADAGTNDAFFGSGRPWCDPRAHGATASAGGTNTDDTAAFLACQTAMPNGGEIRVSNGHYCLSSGLSITTGGIYLVGESKKVQLEACGVDVTPVSMASSNGSIETITICGKGAPCDDNESTFAATQPALLANSCAGCRLNDLIVYGGNRNIQSTALLQLTYVVGGFAYGDLIVLNGGSFINDSSADQNWPGIVPTPLSVVSVPAYAATTSYTAGQVVTFGGYYIEAITSGTSGGGGSVTLRNYGLTISDANTLTWQLASKTGSVAWRFSGANTETYAKLIDATGANDDGIFVSAGSYFKCVQCLAGQTVNAPVAISGSNVVHFTNLSTGAGLIQQTAAIITTNAFTGFLGVEGSDLAGDYGVIVGGGTTNIVANHITASGFYGVSLANSITNYSIVANQFSGTGCVIFGTGNNFGVFTNNVCNGTTITGSVGTNSSAYGNDGSAVPVANGGTGVTSAGATAVGNISSATPVSCPSGITAGTVVVLNGIVTHC